MTQLEINLAFDNQQWKIKDNAVSTSWANSLIQYGQQHFTAFIINMKNLCYSFMELTVKFITEAQRERQREVT